MSIVFIRRRLYSTYTENSKLFQLHPVATLKQRKFPTYVGHPNSIIKSLIWTNPPKNILIVKKPWHDKVLDATLTFVKHIYNNYPSVNIIVTPEVADELKDINDKDENSIPIFTGPINEIITKTELIVSLGGDGTILRGVSLFSNTTVPPVLSFSLGTLGFLLPFDFANHAQAFKEVFESRSSMLKRERIECHIVKSNHDSEIINKKGWILKIQ